MLTTPFWRIAGVSVEGTSHQKNQSGCQDAHKYCRLSDEMIVLAVADGAGSAKQAAQGANTSVQVACERVAKALAEEIPTSEAQWQALLAGMLETVHRVLAEMALSTPPSMSSEEQKASADPNCHILKIDDLATTLTVVVITPGWIASAQVGDGAVICQVLGDGASEEVLTVLGPDHGEYINETVFVTGQDYLSRAQYACLPLSRVLGIALLTDGVTGLGLEDATGRAHAPFFSPFFEFVGQADEDVVEHELTAFLQLPQVCKQTGDDKTLVLAVAVQSGQEDNACESTSLSQDG